MHSPLWDFIQAPGEELPSFLSFLVAIIVAITVHEYAHAKAAQLAGDPTAEQAGRVTLNPLAHFDVAGTIMLLLAGFGWGKPVPVNPMLFRRPRIDDIMVSLWGPLSNFIAAAVFALPLKFGFAGEYGLLLHRIVLLNLVLGLFNLIPIHPLDGSHILSGLLPVDQARRLDEFYHRFGVLLLILLIVSQLTYYVVGIPAIIVHGFLTAPLFLGLAHKAGRHASPHRIADRGLVPRGRGTVAKIEPGDIVCLVLCAGEGTRMRPLTYTRPKQLLPLCNVPVIDHILSAISEAGLREIGMVTGPDPRGLRSHVGDGRRWGLDVAWLVQETPKGIGDAVLAAKSYVGERPFIVYLGDALYEGGIGGFVQQFAEIFPASLVRLTPVEEPQHYGVAVVEDSFITELEEKPKKPRTNLAITGLYAFPPEFFDAICRTPPSDRGELEITDSIANFLDNPAGVRAEVWEGGWADAGQHHTFLEANRQVLDRAEDFENAGVVEDSVLNGKVGVGDGTTITGSHLDGPVLLGEGCRVVNSCIGPYVSVGDRSVIQNSNVRNTVIDADVLVADLRRGLDGSIVGVRSKLIGNGRGGTPVRQLVGDDTQLHLDQAEPQVSP